jgi:hypothetical protein
MLSKMLVIKKQLPMVIQRMPRRPIKLRPRKRTMKLQRNNHLKITAKSCKRMRPSKARTKR